MDTRPHLAACPTTATLARLADGQLALAERVLLEQHLRACPLCRALTAGLARAQGRVAPVPPVAVAPVGGPPATPAKPPSLWWVPLATHTVLALLVGAAAWWLLGRAS